MGAMVLSSLFDGASAVLGGFCFGLGLQGPAAIGALCAFLFISLPLTSYFCFA